ncbi:hypothetical protein BDQ12DRAFT_695848 [Crucibulum laeve]|uniref:Virilizer N-terminal domain-containing protein n=1 Tax=Crucibulum laeve TaxID=68775 RepID=A0A5C3MHH0_9AGAR|nr:hypothetical protein BDQ12DRAFT_695848 [Crucibulum laeve]
MSLLHWCTLLPQGPSNLAAARFAAPIRVSSIRVFPNGAQPFRQSPEIIATTEPDAFYLDVFFNAQALRPSQDSKEKQRALNALIPTVIAYAGGQVDFTVDMGTEYATRLMIVKGKFEKLSMAIYGQIVSESSPVNTYQSKPLPVFDPYPLSKAVDPSNSSDPTMLAQQLLALIPDPPPLSLVIRLMLCLKPSDEDWDDENFPYLYADLETEDEDLDLEATIQSASRPVRDDVSEEALTKFATRIADFIGPKNNDQALQIAKILSISASQIPDMTRVLLKHLDLGTIFDERTLEEQTVLSLLDAVSNVEVARNFSQNEAFMTALRAVQENPRSDKHTQIAVRRLLARIYGWVSFNDALSNTLGDFATSAHLLKDIGTDEHSIGIWLESMTIHDDLVAKLLENPVLPTAQSGPPPLIRNPATPVSHDEFLVFVRGFIGIASVLAVWAWADSVGNDECRERTLAVLNLWQGTEGYREILNHLLLLRQFTRRLGWIANDNDPPRKSGILAEKVLSNLARDPHAILHDELVKTILSLEPPLSFIAEGERLSMRKIALVSEDGLPAAVDELTFKSDRPFSLRRLRTLRVSLAIVERELLENPQGEWRVLETFWEEQSHGLVPSLVDILVDISDDLNQHFAVKSAPKMNQSVSDQLFQTAGELMKLIGLLAPAFPLTSRTLRALTGAVADLFACSDVADMTFAQSSSACISAQNARQICLELLRGLSGPTAHVDPGKLGAEVILRSLLDHATKHGGRDPAYHLLQVFNLCDHILPDPAGTVEDGEPSHWVTSVFPSVTTELKSFFRLLDTDNQVHLVRRLVKMDDGVTGIGEFILMEELKFLSETLQTLEGPIASPEYRLAQQYQVYLTLRFLHDLVSPTSGVSPCSDLAGPLKQCLSDSSVLTYTTQILAKNAAAFDPYTQFSILLDSTSPSALDSVLDVAKRLPPTAIIAEPLRTEVGRTLDAFADHTSTLEPETAEDLLSILEWLLQQDNPNLTVLYGIQLDAFTRLCDTLVAILPPERYDAITVVSSKFSIDEDEMFIPPSLPLQSIEKLLSTPKGSKTPDILGVVISPPTALLRSPAATGLTKTQLRQAPSASMHVDVGINGHLTSTVC